MVKVLIVVGLNATGETRACVSDSATAVGGCAQAGEEILRATGLRCLVSALGTDGALLAMAETAETILSAVLCRTGTTDVAVW